MAHPNRWADVEKEADEPREEPLPPGGFQGLMQQAVKLKTAQQSTMRGWFDGLPQFYQHSLYANEEQLAWRSLPFAEKIQQAQALKSEADMALRSGNKQDASYKYELSIGIFRYLYNTNPEWKKRGINDDTIREGERCRRGQQRGVRFIERAPLNNWNIFFVLPSTALRMQRRTLPCERT